MYFCQASFSPPSLLQVSCHQWFLHFPHDCQLVLCVRQQFLGFSCIWQFRAVCCFCFCMWQPLQPPHYICIASESVRCISYATHTVYTLLQRSRGASLLLFYRHHNELGHFEFDGRQSRQSCHTRALLRRAFGIRCSGFAAADTILFRCGKRECVDRNISGFLVPACVLLDVAPTCSWTRCAAAA